VGVFMGLPRKWVNLQCLCQLGRLQQYAYRVKDRLLLAVSHFIVSASSKLVSNKHFMGCKAQLD